MSSFSPPSPPFRQILILDEKSRKSYVWWEIQKVLCLIRNPGILIVDKKTENLKVSSWIRKPESLILHEETEKSYLTWENPKVFYCMRNWNVFPMSSQCLPNDCPTFPNSAQSAQWCSSSNLGFLSICVLSIKPRLNCFTKVSDYSSN